MSWEEAEAVRSSLAALRQSEGWSQILAPEILRRMNGYAAAALADGPPDPSRDLARARWNALNELLGWLHSAESNAAARLREADPSAADLTA